ncbi:MAG: LCP family protein [Oscillospiraceae bacterium]|nr:LCP family protein [Oscillospiraceae bacterium]
MKQKRIWNGILIAVLALQLLAEGIAAWAVLRLDMLPVAYCLVLVSVLAVMGISIGLLMFLHRKEKTVGRIRRIVACILAALVILGCGAVCKVATDIYETMHSITAPPAPSVTRSIFVRANDPAQELTDAADYSFGAVEFFDLEGTRQALEVLEQVFGKKAAVSYYTSVTEMVDALYSGSADAIILNGAYVEMLEETAEYADFSEKTKLLYDVPIEGWTASSQTGDSTDTSNSTEQTETIPQKPAELDITQKSFVMFIGGSDTNKSYLPTITRYDVNIMMVVNPVTKQVLLLNTPRDYFVKNPAGGGVRDKLTHCGNFGVECSIQALKELYGFEVDYYARINFAGVETLIDAVGGVTVTSDASFTGHLGTEFVIGENHLNGQQALEFMRERKELSGGDNDRGKNQMKVIKALIHKVTSGTALISGYAQILDALSGMFETSIGMEDLSKLVKMQLTDMASWNVQSYAVTGRGGNEETYSWPGKELYVMYVDEAHVAYASGLVQRVMAGEILTNEDLSKK